MDKILVIEDDSQLREMLKYFLQDKGFSVQCSENGREGLKDAHRFDPDLIILDIVMPEMDGYEVIHEIRRSKNLKIIAISGGGVRLDQGPALLRTARHLGADRTLQKPLDLDQLYQEIHGLLQTR